MVSENYRTHVVKAVGDGAADPLGSGRHWWALWPALTVSHHQCSLSLWLGCRQCSKGQPPSHSIWWPSETTKVKIRNGLWYSYSISHTEVFQRENVYIMACLKWGCMGDGGRNGLSECAVQPECSYPPWALDSGRRAGRAMSDSCGAWTDPFPAAGMEPVLLGRFISHILSASTGALWRCLLQDSFEGDWSCRARVPLTVLGLSWFLVCYFYHISHILQKILFLEQKKQKSALGLEFKD